MITRLLRYRVHPLVFSDDEEEITKDEMEDVIDATNKPREDISFYRQLDPDNLEHYPTFISAVYKDDTPYFGEEDTHLELCVPKNRDDLEFDKFSGFEKSAKKLKAILKNFKEESNNPFFDAIIFDLMTYMTEGEKALDLAKFKRQ